MKHIIDTLGGTVKVSQALGVKHSAVSNWRRRGIPDGQKWRILRLAQERGLAVSLDHLDGRAAPADDTKSAA